MRADNTHHIIAAAQQRHELTRATAIQALRTLDTQGARITFEAVAHTVGISRSWLYSQPDIRAEIEHLRTTSRRTLTPLPTRQRTSEASLLRRLDAANRRNRALSEENRRLREQLSRALGEARNQGRPKSADAREH